MKIPSEIEFGASDFLDSEDIKKIGEGLLRAKLTHLDDGELLIDYRFKRRGGTSGGSAVLGKCVKLTGLARHLGLGAHFCVWLAADHLRAAKFNDKQLEALVYHELCHIEREEPDDEDKPELTEYGAWRPTLERLEEAIRQLPLPMEVATG